MKMRRTSRVVSVLLLLASIPLSGAPKKPTPIQLEDPELYYAFLESHNQLAYKIQTSGAATSAQMSSATAAIYGVNATDFQALDAEVRK